MESEDLEFQSWGYKQKIRMVESEGMKQLFVKGQPYLKWAIEDETAERMAVVQLYELGFGTQEELAEIFHLHVNSVSKYVGMFRSHGVNGLKRDVPGPKGTWKLVPEMRAKILMIVLKEGIEAYEDIRRRLEERWGQKISIASIRQVLMENGFVEEKIRSETTQGDLFEEGRNGSVAGLELFWISATQEERTLGDGKGSLGWRNPEEEIDSEEGSRTDAAPERIARYLKMGREAYSQAKRIYLDTLERGQYSAYAGGLLFVPLIERHHFLEMLQKVIDVPTHEGYSLEQFGLTFFYFDVFEFRSIEDFKTVYPEEYGVLIGRASSPSQHTLRRFLHRVRELKKGERLMEEFGKEYLKSGLVQWGVIYIDGHFLPYYGMRVITMGWHGVQEKALKGSYQFLAVDKEFNPFLFLIRPSSEDLLEKIPELIAKAREVGREAGMDVDDLTVIFDREGYSAELFRKLDEMEPKVKFITWAKYMDRWLDEYKEKPFDKSVMVQYEIQEEDEIKYFETDRMMNKYGKVRVLILESSRKGQRSAIFTNDDKTDGGKIIQLMCRRWGQETLNKTQKWDHKMDYFPGYVDEELEEQPWVDNPKLKELKRQKAAVVGELNGLRIQFAQKTLTEAEDETNWKEMKEKNKELFIEMTSLQAQVTLLDLEIAKFPKEIRFNEAHNGKALVALDYEKKRFLDCIKIFTYMMEKKMCSILSEYYEDPKDIYVILSMIVRRGGEIKLEGGRLNVRLKGFRNSEVGFAARRLCEKLNQMQPHTLDSFQFPILYEAA